MRFLPSVRYGTEGYPEKVARRLRGVNLSAWVGAAVAGAVALSQSFASVPGLWKAAIANGLAALAFAFAPLLHRFGPVAAPVAGIMAAYALIFAMTMLFGTESGIHRFYQLFPAFVILAIGLEHIRLVYGLVALGIAMAVVVTLVAPADSGLLPATRRLYGDIVVFTVAGSVGLFLIVLYAFRQAARSEAAAEREAERAEAANRHKSQFLASASHDLRQPLHALNLFVARLRSESDPTERSRLVAGTEAAVSSMNEMFESLLDMTKLDAGILQPAPTAFPIARLIARIETTFAGAAGKKGLSLRVVGSGAWVASDPILLERILLNLVSNAVRYTKRGGVLVGCRRRGTHLRIDVCDTGIGIAEEQRQHIFSEYYQLTAHSGGLGLGLAIVDRLGRLLGHPVELVSHPGGGSRFSVSVPLTAQPGATMEPRTADSDIPDPARGKRVIVIDDDALVLDGMRGILESWGCQVETAASGAAALAALAPCGRAPDLIISDFRLADGNSGIDAIKRLRDAIGASVPACIITGDTAPERLREARAGSLPLLHKPVSPMALRTTVNRLLRSGDAPPAAAGPNGG